MCAQFVDDDDDKMSTSPRHTSTEINVQQTSVITGNKHLKAGVIKTRTQYTVETNQEGKQYIVHKFFSEFQSLHSHLVLASSTVQDCPPPPDLPIGGATTYFRSHGPVSHTKLTNQRTQIFNNILSYIISQPACFASDAIVQTFLGLQEEALVNNRNVSETKSQTTHDSGAQWNDK
jgi:hypothetical protein